MSPLVRRWLAERLEDWVNHGYAICRALGHALGITTEWDPLELDREYRNLAARIHAQPLNVPAPVSAVAAGTKPGTAPPTPAPSPALNTVLPCKTCGAHSNASCRNRYGEETGPHKSRRDATAAASDLSGES